MSAIDLAAFLATPLVREPFDHLIVPGFIKPEAWPAVQVDFPEIDRPGSFPLSETSFFPAFRALINELEGTQMRLAFQEKFDLDLGGRPTMVTVRGQCQQSDGRIHTDAATKIITVLIYMNSCWEPEGGRLRLLRSADDLDDFVVEVPPEEGTLLAFRRSDNSWHGHKPFVGPRRVIQLNWVADERVVRREIRRHRVSARFKRMLSLVRPPERQLYSASARTKQARSACQRYQHKEVPGTRHALPALALRACVGSSRVKYE
jgi:SM-20-related protein